MKKALLVLLFLALLASVALGHGMNQGRSADGCPAGPRPTMHHKNPH